MEYRVVDLMDMNSQKFIVFTDRSTIVSTFSLSGREVIAIWNFSVIFFSLNISEPVIEELLKSKFNGQLTFILAIISLE